MHTRYRVKTPLKSEPLWFGHQWCFIIILVLTRFLKTDFSFLCLDEKEEKYKFSEKIFKTNIYEPICLSDDSGKSECFKAYSCSFCSGVLYLSFACGRFVL